MGNRRPGYGLWSRWRRKTTAPSRSPFHAVSVDAPKHACSAVNELSAKKFLPAEAPRLPLVGCDQPDNCRCRYQHHADRRGEPRRADEAGLPSSASDRVENRRVQKGRRATDVVVESAPDSAPAVDYFEHTSTIRRKKLEVSDEPAPRKSPSPE